MKIRFVNYRKEFPNMSQAAFSDLFTYVERWDGSLIYFGIKHFVICLDFRDNVVEDLVGA